MLLLRRLAGKAQVVQVHGSKRRGRAIRPNRIDQIGIERHQARGGCSTRFRYALCSLNGMEPRVIAETIVPREVLLHPLLRLVEMLDRKKGAIHLPASLQRVASVDEEDGAIEQNDRGSGRSGETSQPGKPFLACRHRLILMLV